MAQASGDDAARVELTERQREVLRLIAAGKTNPEIGEALGISLDGAKWHVREIMAKLDVSTREEAGEWWLAHEGLRSRMARALRAIVPASLWLRVGLGVAVAVGGAAVVLGVIAVTGSGEKGTSSSTAKHVTGTVKSYTEATFSAPMVVSSPAVVVLTDGTTFQLSLKTQIYDRTEPLVMMDLTVGNVVAVNAVRAADGSLIASRVTLFSEPVASAALVGPAVGLNTAPDGSLMALGSISARDATSLQLSYPGGSVTAICGAGCAVRRDIATGPSDLKPGAKITATVTNGVADLIQFVQ